MRTLLALLATAGMATSALAQGTVIFNSDVWESTVPRRVLDMNGAPLVGTDWVAQLYHGSTPYDLHPVTDAPARFRFATTTQAGTWEGGTRTLTGLRPGDTFLIPMTNDMGFFELGWCWCPP